MEECCIPSHKKTQKPGLCPQCHQEGKTVQKITMEHLLKESFVSQIREIQYYFCPMVDCPIVYFSELDNEVFLKNHLRVRVGQKETENPIPVCYCFNFTKKDITEDIERTGKSTIMDSIKKKVTAGNCFCEISNPQGSCCLGNIQMTLNKFMKTAGTGFYTGPDHSHIGRGWNPSPTIPGERLGQACMLVRFKC